VSSTESAFKLEGQLQHKFFLFDKKVISILC